MNLDLHHHSNCSDDGEFSVEEILNISKQQGVEHISVTDYIEKYKEKLR